MQPVAAKKIRRSETTSPIGVFKRARGGGKAGIPATELRFCSVKNRGASGTRPSGIRRGGRATYYRNKRERGSKREGQPDKKHPRRRE